MSGPSFKIGPIPVGGAAPAFVIAEIGCNHENDFARALEMIRAVGAAGAQAAKLQSFTPEKLVTRTAKKFWDIPGCPGQTQLEEFQEIKPVFTPEQYREMQAAAEKAGVVLFSTPCDEDWADFLDGLGTPAFKVMSMDITHPALIRHIARKGKPVILSTGASTVPEVRAAVHAAREAGARDIALLHCISSYPTPPSETHLGMIADLRREFPDCVVGYSDHTAAGADLDASVVAVALGAKVVEKHFTFDSKRPGYDHEISADYAGLARMVRNIRAAEALLGRDRKEPTELEAKTRAMGRRSLVAAARIPKGTPIVAAMLAAKRPGTGIPPDALDKVVGKRAARDIEEDATLSWEDVT
ncbi:hypothetical protein EPO15_04545 [bacterium]|nr:MAG: hypothetical protein EPO15_04545 [bacterium]